MAKKQNNTLSELGVKERISLSCLELNEGQIVGIPKNPRYLKGEEHDKLKKSLKDSPELLQYKPLMVYAAEGGKFVVICGNMRLRICQELHNEGVEGFDALPCFVLNKDVSIAKIKEYAIKDNVQAGNWDWDELANGDWEVDDLQDWGVDCSFLTDTEPVKEMSERKETEDDEYDEDEHEIEAKCKLGDIWQLGRHRLMCGDSTDASQVAKLLGGTNIQLYLTDPPYNVAYGYNGAPTEKHRKDGLIVLNDKMDNDKFEEFLTNAFNAANANMEKGASFYIFHSDGYSYWFRKALINTVDLELRENLIWVKNSMTLGRQDYQWRHEPCLYGWKKGASHNWFSDRKQTTVMEFDRPPKSVEHPTMKPIPLFAYLIQNSSQEGWNVYDSFGGSGTTIMACEQLDRNGFSMELDPHYCDVIINRWETYTGKKAEKITV
nr:MAG TPA: adenine specific DNA methyltransferase [Caudoviricetes sp.]